MATKDVLTTRAEKQLHDKAEHVAETYDDLSKSDVARVLMAVGAETENHSNNEAQTIINELEGRKARERFEGAFLNAAMVSVAVATLLGGATGFLGYGLLTETLYTFGVAFFFLLVFALSHRFKFQVINE